MIIKFFKRGSVKDIHYSTGGESAKRYLLGKDYADGVASREHARLLAGDPDEVTEIINGLEFSKIYTSGCLAFDGIESQYVTETMKRELMAEFEQCLFTGLDKSQYAGYWVEHFDKLDEKNNHLPRLELNFVFANVELTTGKALPVYYHLIDEKRVDTFKEIKNLEMSLSDPNALERKRLTRIGDKLPQNVKDTLADIDKKLTEAFVDESVNNRDDVIRYLSEHYDITAIKNQSISIKNPHGGTRPIRLQGAFYDKKFEYRGALGEEFDQTKNHRRHRDSPDNERISKLKADYQRYCDKRSAELTKRFKPRVKKQSELGRRKDNRVTANACFTYRPVIRLPAPFRDFNQYFPYFRQTATSLRSVERENRVEFTTANRADRNSVIGTNTESGQQPRVSSEPSPVGFNNTDGQSASTVPRFDDIPRPVPTEDRASVSSHEQTADWLFDNSILSVDILNEHKPRRAGQVGDLEQFYDSDDSHHPVYLGGMGHLFGVSEHSKSGGLAHATEPSQSAAANVTRQAVTRAAHQNGQLFSADEPSAANPNQQYPVTVSTDVIDQAYANYRAGSKKTESANAEQGGGLFERITVYQSTATKNAQIRQGRISALTNQDAISLEPIRSYTERRRQRDTAILNRLNNFGDQFTAIDSTEHARTEGFIGINQRLRKLKKRDAGQTRQLDAATYAIGAICGVVKAVAEFSVKVLEKLFGKLSKEIQGMDLVNTQTGQKLSSQDKKALVSSHPFSLSWYDFLRAEANRLKKEKDNSPKPRR